MISKEILRQVITQQKKEINIIEPIIQRELSELIEAMKKFNLKEGIILTFEQENEIKTENKK